MTTFLIIALLTINAVAFLLFKIDKRNAILGKRRVSELTLCLITLIGGTIGSLMSMQIYRHKTRKKSFIFKIILIAVLQCSALIFLIDRI
ncbi:DUF1294 domain-containing protein [Empedobacter falsenii]